MRPDHVVRARFVGVTPLSGVESAGLALRFQLLHARIGVSEIEDYADLGPELTPLAVEGVGKLLRLLRAARIAPPPSPFALAGDAASAAQWASRALGAAVRLSLRRRSSVRFTAWTETGMVEVDDVAEVREDEDAIWVIRREVRLPMRLDRAGVVRRTTETLRSFEVLAIERDPALGSTTASGRASGWRPPRGRTGTGTRTGEGSPDDSESFPAGRPLPARTEPPRTCRCQTPW